MRFRTPAKPPPFLNRRDQLRILLLFGTLALVLVAMKVASNPNLWFWLTAPPEATTSQGDAKPTRDIDFRVRPDDEQRLSPDVFRVPPQDDAVAVDLAAVHDNTLGIRRGEAAAYYELLSRAREARIEDLEAAARRDVAFPVLMLDPKLYRGQLLTIEGDARRAVMFAAAANEHGFEQLSELWLVTADSGTNPYRVVCTSLPPGMPTGEQIEPPVRVRVTGYFFKRFGYAAQHGLHLAPLLLANEPRWLSATATAATTGKPGYQWFAVVVLLLVLGVAGSAGLVLWQFSASKRAFAATHLKRLTAAPAEAMEALEGIETIDPRQFMGELAEATASDEMPADGGSAN